MVGNGRSSFVVLVPNMSSLALLENGGGAQKRNQQSEPHGVTVFLSRDFSPSMARRNAVMAQYIYCIECVLRAGSSPTKRGNGGENRTTAAYMRV